MVSYDNEVNTGIDRGTRDLVVVAMAIRIRCVYVGIAGVFVYQRGAPWYGAGGGVLRVRNKYIIIVNTSFPFSPKTSVSAK